jgi:hypothetical protein
VTAKAKKNNQIAVFRLRNVVAGAFLPDMDPYLLD